MAQSLLMKKGLKIYSTLKTHLRPKLSLANNHYVAWAVEILAATIGLAIALLAYDAYIKIDAATTSD